MNKILSSLIFILAIINGVQSEQNGCVSFTVSQGTGCQWMCNYCSTQLGTSNYYFTDGVCTYQTEDQVLSADNQVLGGCVGNPIAGKQYTCCAVNESSNEL